MSLELSRGSDPNRSRSMPGVPFVTGALVLLLAGVAAANEKETEAAEKDKPPTEPAPEAPPKRPRGRPKGSKNKPKPAEGEETEEEAPVKRTRSTRAA